nr:MAG: replication associated protein [Cressdnaviricota sp.]
MPPSPQGRYWLLTIPHSLFTPWRELPSVLQYVRGQREIGGTTGFEHWQILVASKKPIRRTAIVSLFTPGGECHAELSRSRHADEYVWKEETRVPGSQFELGTRAIKRNSSTDWALVRTAAIAGDFESIDADIFVRYYGNLRRIHSDYARPLAIVRSCKAFIGTTGTGKSKLAWEEAGETAYIKNPTTKWWDGYQGQEHVIIDEFRGDINISHLLRWFDRYPVNLEIKGSSIPLSATKFWICSNLTPREWYPLVDEQSMDALMRRMELINFA